MEILWGTDNKFLPENSIMMNKIDLPELDPYSIIFSFTVILKAFYLIMINQNHLRNGS